MNKTTIIIPSRLNAQRFPNKPLKLINNKEMILHVYDAAIKSNAGEVYVATPDQKIVDTVKNSGGNAIKTSNNHETGTDRIFEVFKDTLNGEPNIIINLQGDIATTVTQQVKVTSNQKQVPEVAHNLSYYVYLIPNIKNYMKQLNVTKNIVLTDFTKTTQKLSILPNNTEPICNDEFEKQNSFLNLRFRRSKYNNLLIYSFLNIIY